MDDVHAEKQRDLQAALFDGDPLYFFDFCLGFYIEETAYFSGRDLLCDIGAAGLAGGDIACAGEVELAELFIEGHFGHEGGDKSLHFVILSEYRRKGKQQKQEGC
jgi:hypothetical protein